MNTSYKCNCCCKEDVCKYKDEYISDCNRIKNQVNTSMITEVSIKCKKFQKNQVNMRGADNRHELTYYCPNCGRKMDQEE